MTALMCVKQWRYTQPHHRRYRTYGDNLFLEGTIGSKYGREILVNLLVHTMRFDENEHKFICNVSRIHPARWDDILDDVIDKDPASRDFDIKIDPYQYDLSEAYDIFIVKQV